MDLVLEAPAPVLAAVIDGRGFPVNRIYCIGRNYADHVAEMGGDAERDPPVFFSKPADALVSNHKDIPYPPGTGNLHHEVELVVALASGGADIAPEQALKHVFGYAVGNDLTRRDLQHAAKKAGQPWDSAKGFDHSAPISALIPAADVDLADAEISLHCNGELRQRAQLADMIWSVAEIIAALSQLYTLKPGDLIFTGTPAGVGAIAVGDSIEASISGLDTLQHRIV